VPREEPGPCDVDATVSSFADTGCELPEARLYSFERYGV